MATITFYKGLKGFLKQGELQTKQSSRESRNVIICIERTGKEDSL